MMLRMGIAFWTIVITAFTLPVSAQDTTASRQEAVQPTALPRQVDVPEWYEMFTNIPGDWVNVATIATQPKNLIAIGEVGFLTVGLMACDDQTWRLTRDRASSSAFVESGAEVIHSLGDGKYHLGLAAGLAAYGFVAEDRRAIRTASQTVEAVLSAGIVVQVLKRITGRESPAMASSKSGRWRFLPNQAEYNRTQPKFYAFPSGHITTTVATLTVLMENYPEAGWLKPVSYSLVGLVGISLVASDLHWYSDLPLGIMLGYTFGRVAARHSSGKVEEGGSLDVFFSPFILHDGAGLYFSVPF